MIMVNDILTRLDKRLNIYISAQFRIDASKMDKLLSSVIIWFCDTKSYHNIVHLLPAVFCTNYIIERCIRIGTKNFTFSFADDLMFPTVMFNPITNIDALRDEILHYCSLDASDQFENLLNICNHRSETVELIIKAQNSLKNFKGSDGEFLALFPLTARILAVRNSRKRRVSAVRRNKIITEEDFLSVQHVLTKIDMEKWND